MWAGIHYDLGGQGYAQCCWGNAALNIYSWNACSITKDDCDTLVSQLSQQQWEAICIQEGFRHVAEGVNINPERWILHNKGTQRGATMLVLSQRLGNRLKNYIFGDWYVIAHIAVSPPLLLASLHAPTANHGQETFETCFSSFLSDLEALGLNRIPGIRLVIGADLNVQLNTNPPFFGDFVGTGERWGEAPRAGGIQGVVATLNLSAPTTFTNTGPTRRAWSTQSNSQEEGTIID